MTPPKLTIISYFNTHSSVVEDTLSAIYTINRIPFELIIINDGNEQNRGIIESNIEYYGHEYTYFFNQDDELGIGVSLNEALAHAAGDIIWTVSDISTIDEDVLSEITASLRVDQKPFACLDIRHDYTHLSAEKLLTLFDSISEQSFLWNWSLINPNHRFFNPFLKHFANCELFLRISGQPTIVGTEQAFTSTHQEALLSYPAEINECKISLSRLSQKSTMPNKEPFLITDDDTPVMDENSTVMSSYDEPVIEKELETYPDFYSLALDERKKGNLAKALSIIKQQSEEDKNDDELRLEAELLEQLGRYVESAELKQRSRKRKEKQQTDIEIKDDSESLVDDLKESEAIRIVPDPMPEIDRSKIKVSIIIPTALYGKHLLETALASINQHIPFDNTELLIIDNVSLDDTHDYLSFLREQNFYNCRILTQTQNLGFGAAINIGLDKAYGDFALILHNDIVLNSDLISRWLPRFSDDESLGILGPMTNATLNTAQLFDEETTKISDLFAIDYLDSFCMMCRILPDIRFDEQFMPAFYDDIDFCRQYQKAGYDTKADPGAYVEHFFAQTTGQFVLLPGDKRFYKHEVAFQNKWQEKPELNIDLNSLDPLSKLLHLEPLIPVIGPDEEQKNQYDTWFTDEVKTVVLNETWEEDIYLRLISLFMKIDQRDVLRRLEEKATNYTLPDMLVYQLVEFYYDKNIYSRVRFYIDNFTSDDDGRYTLFKLKIAWADKDLDTCYSLINRLFETNPGNPELLVITAELHQLNDNEGEAKDFREISQQVAPWLFSFPNSNTKISDK